MDVVNGSLEKAESYAARAGRRDCEDEARAGFYKQALEQVEEILAADAKNLRAFRLKGQILTKVRPVDAVEVLETILLYDLEGHANFEEAMELLDAIQELKDAGDDDRVYRLDLDVQAMDTNGTYMKGVVSGPGHLISVNIMLAEALQAAGEWARAEDVYTRHFCDSVDSATPPQHRMMLSGISLCSFSVGEQERAAELAQVAMDINRHSGTSRSPSSIAWEGNFRALTGRS